MLARSVRSLALASLALSLPAAAGEVWTVAPSGADFTEIQAAVDAAAAGDLVLVRAGSYGQFGVFDKSLTVAAEAPGAVQVSGQVRVQNVAAGSVVTLIDLEVTGNGERALYLVSNPGSVRVRGGSYHGTDFAQPWFGAISDGIGIVDSDDVSLRAVQARGGLGLDAVLNPISGPSSGGHGIRAVESRVAIHHGSAAGGDGGSDYVGEGYWGGWGGHGLWVVGGYVYVCNSTFAGGDGGAGGEEDGYPPFGNAAGNGGNGGDGVNLRGGAAWYASKVHADLLAVTATGGIGGAGGLGYWGPDGSPGLPGVPIALQGDATTTDLGNVVRRLIADPLLTAGSRAQVTVAGQPGEVVALIFSKGGKFAAAPGNLGVWLLGGLPLAVKLGQLDAFGLLTVDWSVPSLAPSAEGTTLHLQALMGAPGGRALTGSSVTAILQPGI